MPKICFSDVGLRNLPAPERGQIDYWDTSFKAGVFGCRVSQGGTKTFQIKSRNRRITIGKYPAISLQDARGEAKRLFAEITLGKVHPEAVTYARAVDLFIEEKTKARRARTVAGYKRLLNNFGFRGKLSELTHGETQRSLKRFTAPGEYNLTCSPTCPRS